MKRLRSTTGTFLILDYLRRVEIRKTIPEIRAGVPELRDNYNINAALHYLKKHKAVSLEIEGRVPISYWTATEYDDRAVILLERVIEKRRPRI